MLNTLICIMSHFEAQRQKQNKRKDTHILEIHFLRKVNNDIMCHVQDDLIKPTVHDFFICYTVFIFISSLECSS